MLRVTASNPETTEPVFGENAIKTVPDAAIGIRINRVGKTRARETFIEPSLTDSRSFVMETSVSYLVIDVNLDLVVTIYSTSNVTRVWCTRSSMREMLTNANANALT